MSLRCPQDHHWNPLDELKVPSETPPGFCHFCALPAELPPETAWNTCGILALLSLGLIGPFLLLARLGVDNKVLSLVWGNYLTIYLIAVGVLVWWANQRANQWRRGALQELSRALSFSWEQPVPKDKFARWTTHPIWKNGSNHEVLVWMEGTYQSCRVVVMDFAYRKFWGKRSRSQTVLAFLDPIVGLPDFTVEPTADRRELWNQDVLQWVGLRARKPLEDAIGPCYALSCDDQEAVEGWLGPRLHEWLEQNPGWAFGAQDGRLVVFRPSKVCRPDEYLALMAHGWLLHWWLREAEPSNRAL